MENNNIIDEWLSKNNNPEIEKQVEQEAKEIMENTKKLELTLCSMLPYGLRIINAFKEETPVFSRHFYDEFGNFIGIHPEARILLHSLDKLTEPILEGGLIPIVELAKETAWFETLKDTEVEYDSDDEDTWRNVYDKHGDKVLWTINFNHTTACFVQMIPDTPNISYQKECWEFLKKHHFNLYDLPKEMYIEKSETK